MPDLWNGCFEPSMGMSPANFGHTFCRVCRNPECSRSAVGGSKWLQRMATQADRLLDNPQFADPNDPKFADIRKVDFPSALREAMRLEISDRRNDWTIPTDADAARMAVEMSAGAAQPVPAVEDPPPSPPEEDDAVGRVLREYSIRGTKGDTYAVALVEKVVGRPEWTCTCKAFEYGTARPCKHIEYAAQIPEDEPLPTLRPAQFQTEKPVDVTPVRAASPPKADPPKVASVPPQRQPTRPFIPPMGNIPVPSGGVMVDGSKPPPPKERPNARPAQPPAVDPWAPPSAKPANVVPVGAKVVLGGKPGPGGKR